jgi:hypothetical protein
VFTHRVWLDAALGRGRLVTMLGACLAVFLASACKSRVEPGPEQAQEALAPAEGAPEPPLAAPARRPRAEPPPPSIRAEYEQLVAGGCDPAAFGIATPIEARVLRNTPYAIAGQRFDSEALRAVYAADGDWYRPSARRVEIEARDARCVAALKRHEAVVRAQRPIDREVEEVLTREPAVFWRLRGVANLIEAQGASSGINEDGWWWSFTTGCNPDELDEDEIAMGMDPGVCSSEAIVCKLPEGETDWRHLDCDFISSG